MAALKREDLYADVWSRPAATIAAELGLPRNTLKRICAGMEIPTPNTGYWIRARHGRKRTKPGLPPPTPSTRLEWDVDLERARLRRFLKRSRVEGGRPFPPPYSRRPRRPKKDIRWSRLRPPTSGTHWLRWAALRADIMDPLCTRRLPWEQVDIDKLMGRMPE